MNPTKTQIKAAFDIPAALRSEEEAAICAYQLPVLEGNARAERNAELVRRLQDGLPLSIADRREARRLIKAGA